MKNSIFLLVFLLLTSSININSQWQADVRLTNDTARSLTSFNNAWCIASNGDIVHVVWFDTRDGNYEIYYKRSQDAGLNWGADTRLTNNSAISYTPCISVSGQLVIVVWHDRRNANFEIYYKRSTDGGTSWGADIQLTNNSFSSNQPSVSVSSQVVHVVWQDNIQVYYKRSTDGGVIWGAATRLTNAPNGSHFPSVTVFDQVVHVVWQDQRDGNFEIYYKRSIDGGLSWGVETRLTYNSAFSYYPSVSVSGQVVHVVWFDFRDGNYEIYYKRSADGGISWGADTRLTNNNSQSYNPSVSSSGQVVHVVWYDERDGDDEIYYKRSTDGGLSWGSDTRLTNHIAYSYNPSVSVSGQVVHVVWLDQRDGNYEIYYKRNPTGNPLGIKNINSKIPKDFKLEQNYPNPFNPSTKIRFQATLTPPEMGKHIISLIVYDVLGRELATLVNEQLQPGTYEVDWDGSNFSSGVYYYKLTAGDFIEVKKMVLLK